MRAILKWILDLKEGVKRVKQPIESTKYVQKRLKKFKCLYCNKFKIRHYFVPITYYKDIVRLSENQKS